MGLHNDQADFSFRFSMDVDTPGNFCFTCSSNLSFMENYIILLYIPHEIKYKTEDNFEE